MHRHRLLHFLFHRLHSFCRLCRVLNKCDDGNRNLWLSLQPYWHHFIGNYIWSIRLICHHHPLLCGCFHHHLCYLLCTFMPLGWDRCFGHGFLWCCRDLCDRHLFGYSWLCCCTKLLILLFYRHHLCDCCMCFVRWSEKGSYFDEDSGSLHPIKHKNPVCRCDIISVLLGCGGFMDVGFLFFLYVVCSWEFILGWFCRFLCILGLYAPVLQFLLLLYKCISNSWGFRNLVLPEIKRWDCRHIIQAYGLPSGYHYFC